MFASFRFAIFTIFVLLIFAKPADANLCPAVKDQQVSQETASEIDYYKELWDDADMSGDHTWNAMILECNRRRDKGIYKRIMTSPAHSALKALLEEQNLDPVLIQGRYRYLGLPGMKYRYVLERRDGEWQVTLPYRPIVNDVVPDTLVFFIGSRTANEWRSTSARMAAEFFSGDSTSAPWERPDTPLAWVLFARHQVSYIRGTPQLREDARPIALTNCSGPPSFFPGGREAYAGWDDMRSINRDRRNRHINLGLVQHRSAGEEYWREGCRIRKSEQLYWVDPNGDVHAVWPERFLLDNFINMAESYWSIPGSFKLRILLEGYNDYEFPLATRNLLGRGDRLTIRFGALFMPYGGNQMYKSNILQFNNLSTMTENTVIWHEVGHALGLDDEYGQQSNSAQSCKADKHQELSPRTYIMCQTNAQEKRTIYHYIATSRYVAAGLCDDNDDCDDGEYCNQRIGLNRCLADRALELGQICVTNRECASNRCQGGNCVCRIDDDCPDPVNQFCNNRLTAPNRCLAAGSLPIGAVCSKNAECSTNRCQGGNCVCRTDTDCPGQRCRTRPFAPNQCG